MFLFSPFHSVCLTIVSLPRFHSRVKSMPAIFSLFSLRCVADVSLHSTDGFLFVVWLFFFVVVVLRFFVLVWPSSFCFLFGFLVCFVFSAIPPVDHAQDIILDILSMSHFRFTLLFHSPGISAWSICIGACHACTALQCDLRDPGWGDPGFRHCDFFALAPIGLSGNVFVSPLESSLVVELDASCHISSKPSEAIYTLPQMMVARCLLVCFTIKKSNPLITPNIDHSRVSPSY